MSAQVQALEAFNTMLADTIRKVPLAQEGMDKLAASLEEAAQTLETSDPNHSFAAIESFLGEGLEPALAATRALQQAADQAATDLTEMDRTQRAGADAFGTVASSGEKRVNAIGHEFAENATSAETALAAAREEFEALRQALEKTVGRVLDECVAPVDGLAAKLRDAARLATTTAAGHEQAATGLTETAGEAALTVDRANQGLIDAHEDVRNELERFYDAAGAQVLETAAALVKGLVEVIVAATLQANDGVGVLGAGLDAVVERGMDAFRAELGEWSAALEAAASASDGLPQQVGEVLAAQAIAVIAQQTVESLG